MPSLTLQMSQTLSMRHYVTDAKGNRYVNQSAPVCAKVDGTDVNYYSHIPETGLYKLAIYAAKVEAKTPYDCVGNFLIDVNSGLPAPLFPERDGKSSLQDAGPELDLPIRKGERQLLRLVKTT